MSKSMSLQIPRAGHSSWDTKMMEKSIGAVVVPTDLETNVDLLHRYLFDVEDYETTDKVKEISKAVSNRIAGKTADTTPGYESAGAGCGCC